MDSFSKGNSKFAFDIFQRMSDGAKNVFICPLSISVTLSMLTNGANGNSRTQLINALHLDKLNSQKKINAAFKDVMKSFSESTGCTLNLANRMYLNENYKVKADFKSNLRDNYMSDAISVNFKENVEEKINKWVASETHGLITDLFASGSFDDLTRLVLVNAIYFKGDWLKKFPLKITGTFYLENLEEKEIEFMGIEKSYFYVYDAQLKCAMAQLLYKGKRLAMYVLLPDEKDGVGRLKTQLTAGNFESMRKLMKKRKVELLLPFFKLRFRRNLIPEVKGMNVKDVFDEDQADLTGISSLKGLYVSKVVHEAYVAVDQTGTVAAACTADYTREFSLIGDVLRPVKFIADHPFVFLIYDAKAKIILFMGTLDDPT